MARITIEDCLEKVGNIYEVVNIAKKRTRQLRKGSKPLVKSRNKINVTALREIAKGLVRRKDDTTKEDMKINDELSHMN